MDISTLFRRLGLPKHAAIVYQTLRKQGPLLVSVIAQKAVLHRPAVYVSLRSLTKHRFISTFPHGKRLLYRAESPKKILQEFSIASEQAARKIERLFPLTETALQNGSIRFLEGSDGIREAFDDVISHTPRGGTFYRYTSEKDLDAVNRLLSPEYRERRDAKKLERIVISNPVSGKRKRPRLERFVRFIPPKVDLFEQNVIQLVYGARLSFIDLDTEQVIIIENRALAEFQKVIFRQLYKQLPDTV